MALLEVDDVYAGYSDSSVLQNVSLSVEHDTVTSLLGRNGVGKTTTLRTIMGLLAPTEGSVRFDGRDITGCRPHEAYKKGIGMVTESRDVFSKLTVLENLRVPMIRDPETEWTVDDLFEFFPKLRELQTLKAKNLSGGEQQMLAIARALRSGPELILFDEPSEGLAPQIVEDVANIITQVAQSETTVLLVEQNVNLALELSSYTYIMDLGEIVYEGSAVAVEENRVEVEQYLGVHEVDT